MFSRLLSRLAQLVGMLACIAPLSSQASVVYQFSLAANGAVGPITIEWTRPAFEPVGGLVVTGLGDASISFASGTPLTAAASVIGFDQDPTESLFGISLNGPGGTVLFTVGYPADFFRFSRDFDDEGVFMSTAGLVTSAFAIDTRTPTARLCVSSSGACAAVVPTPASFALVLLGIGALGGRRACRSRQA